MGTNKLITMDTAINRRQQDVIENLLKFNEEIEVSERKKGFEKLVDW